MLSTTAATYYHLDDKNVHVHITLPIIHTYINMQILIKKYNTHLSFVVATYYHLILSNVQPQFWPQIPSDLFGWHYKNFFCKIKKLRKQTHRWIKA